MQLNPSSYTRLSSTCDSSEVFSSVGEREALRETPGSSSSVGLHSSHPSLPWCYFLSSQLNWKRTAQPNDKKSCKMQIAEIWLRKMLWKHWWKEQLRFQGCWGFLERSKKLYQSHCQINKNTKLNIRVGESVPVLSLTSFSVTFIRFCWHLTTQNT